MILYWKKDNHEAWEHFRKAGIRNIETMQPLYPESDSFMRNFHERHIPISESILEQWNKEADICGSSHGASLKADIKWARKCNEHQDEVLVFKEPKN